MNVSFSYLVTSFFTSYLARECGLSSNTIASYSDCMRLFIQYVCRKLKIEPEQLRMEMVTQSLILDFLDDLEDNRHNRDTTRNVRLATLKSLFHFLARTVPELMHLNECIQAIRAKKTQYSPPPSLTREEVEAILTAPDPAELTGARDAALLQLMYNTGARVQEIADLKVSDIRLTTPFSVTLTGKGRKRRTIPLWEETANVVRHHLNMRGQQGSASETLFLNVRGNPMTRFGIGRRVEKHARAAAEGCPSLRHRRITPHVFRHTTALHLIEADNDITVVRDWLGHADIRTTSQYVEISLERKRKALERVPSPTARKNPELPVWNKPDLVAFLCKLSRGAHNVA